MDNIFTLNEFIGIMKKWEQIVRFKENLWEFRKNEECFDFDFPTLEWSLKLTLEKMFCDDADLGWIEYFAYDLDFGKKYEDGMIKDADDSIIKLATIEDLYNVLIKEMKENGKL
jgi:hypothetical protein